jgi:hypothetical protein
MTRELRDWKPLETIIAHARPGVVLAIPLICTVALAQSTQGTKTPHTPPPAADVKTVAPPVVKGPRPDFVGPTAKPASAPNVVPQAKLPDGLAKAPKIDRERVDVSQPGDGRIWAHGANWKASFGPEGATYIPFFGSNAPTNYPIVFKIDGITSGGEPVGFDGQAAAAVSDRSISFPRGGLVETYDLSPRSVEQSFVFDSLPTAGDLVVRLGVASDLSVSSTADGMSFSNELGQVSYGRAVVRDAAGHASVLESSVDGTSVVTTVPASFLASARLPVTIDPVISTFAIDTTSPNDFVPDTAYDVGHNRYLVVEEETFSSTDHDVYSLLLDSSGAQVNAGYIDISGDYWAAPKVANNLIATQFLVVAEVSSNGGSSPWIIRGVLVGAGGFGMSGQFTISGGESGDKILPSVGGDPEPNAPTYYCVAWTRVFSSSDEDILYQLVDSNGNLVLGGSGFIDNSGSTLDYSPSVSKSDGVDPFSTQEWNVVWTRQFSSVDHDIYAAQIHWDGSITTPSFPLDTSTNDDYFAVASSLHDGASGARNWIVAYNEIVGSDWDVLAHALNGSSVFSSATLSGLESAGGSGTYFENQLYPQVDCDGSKFAVTYCESYMGTPDYDMYIASFALVGTNFLLTEGHQNLDFSADFSYDSGLTSVHSGGGNPGRFMAVWDLYNSSGSSDVWGGLYRAPLFQGFCFPGYDTMPCPCGNSPASFGRGCNNSVNTGGAILDATGVPSNDSVVLHATALKPSATAYCTFFQGANLIQNGLSFGDGIRCAGVPLKRLYFKHAPSGFADAPTGSDPSILNRSAALGDVIGPGSTRWYQVTYRDPANFACGLPSTFNSTNALQIDW